MSGQCYSTVYTSKTWLGVADLSSIPSTSKKILVGIFQDLSTLTDLNWIVSMVKSDLMVTYSITDCSCGSKSNWALVHLCTWKAAANRSNVYVSEKTIIYSLFLRQFKVYQPVQSQRKKGARKNKKILSFGLCHQCF